MPSIMLMTCGGRNSCSVSLGDDGRCKHVRVTHLGNCNNFVLPEMIVPNTKQHRERHRHDAVQQYDDNERDLNGRRLAEPKREATAGGGEESCTKKCAVGG